MMRLGKLDNDALEALVLSKFHKTRPESHAVPGIGQDCATLDLGGDLVVLSTDPITSAGVSHLGQLTVHVSCNDAAAAGAEPVGLLVTLLAPPSADPGTIGRIADDLAAAAKSANVDIIGGHTEVTDSVTRYVTNAAVIARMSPKNVMRGMQAGDDLVLTKWAGLEGSSLLATDHRMRLSALSTLLLDTASGFSSLLSVVPESRIALQNGVSAMHDVTEGGVLGAAWEMAYLSGCGVRLHMDAIPVRPETRAICAALSLDPLRLLSSGSMLIACSNGQLLVSALQKAGIHAAVIGRAEGSGVADETGAPIDPPGADEIYRLFS